MDQPLLEERFCSHCGVDLLPLEVPHLSGSCQTCGRTQYHVRPGEGGKGIKIEAGESFTIPAGWLTMSLDPSRGRGRISRNGIPVFLKLLMGTGMPGNQAELLEKLTAIGDQWEKELQESDKLAGIDLELPDGGTQAFHRLMEEQESREWYILLKIMASIELKQAVEAGDAQAAGYFGLLISLYHALTVVQEPYFEETVWRGYQAGLAVHECSTAADIVPGEVEALAELDPLFERIGEVTLRTWIDSGATLGPRLGITMIPEPLLLARAKWHQDEFKRKREELARAPAERRAESELRLKWLQWFLPGTIIGTVLGKLLTVWGVL